MLEAQVSGGAWAEVILEVERHRILCTLTLLGNLTNEYSKAWQQAQTTK